MERDLTWIAKVVPDFDLSRIPSDLHEFIPADKTDLEAVTALKASLYERLRPILPVLLTWMQDLNWPVAQALVPVLASIGAHLVKDLEPILHSEDEMWKYWILTCLVDTPDGALAKALQPALQKIEPGESEDIRAIISSIRTRHFT
ncbi:DUF5071 domain-containing protein [Allorhizobium taibaishanense]|uniref:DUF5071 domain-containing protein n=1 Tax=Allorhizobium taibaishanense TaxID=887144 RepID=A0A1Q9A4M5_9HYPH|nr:DUF5071 domain-containing protein [Allorhizobium taibaishanense]MBB4006490.1 hypothetical protein [Allorhizobium taibaishanense]OLP49427.1 hypothetical protein BJF91_20525 [Allorhizobium taibaishanense]